MQNSYIRFGRRFAIPSTAQILDELKTDFVPGYVPISRGWRRTSDRPPAKARHMNPRDEQPQELDRWENEGGALPGEETAQQSREIAGADAFTQPKDKSAERGIP